VLQDALVWLLICCRHAPWLPLLELGDGCPPQVELVCLDMATRASPTGSKDANPVVHCDKQLARGPASPLELMSIESVEAVSN
jgi:hypothetical protein